MSTLRDAVREILSRFCDVNSHFARTVSLRRPHVSAKNRLVPSGP